MSTGPAQNTTLRIISTSDVHGQMLNYDYFAGKEVSDQGLVKTATLITQARQETPLNILVENGDLIQGSAFADYAVAEFPVNSTTHPIIQALNALDYDVANLGNHEFNFGLEFLASTYRDAQFPIVASNLELLADAPANLKQRLVPIAWIERQVQLPHNDTAIALRIAVIGVTPPQSMQWDQHHLAGKASIENMLSATQRRVTEAREQGADLVIVAAHTGMPKQSSSPEDSEQAAWLIAGIDGIDALLLGHQHEVFPGTSVYDQLTDVDSKNGRVRGVPTVQPGIYGSHIGVIDLDLNHASDGWHVVSSHSSTRAVTAQVATDRELVAQLQRDHRATLEFMQQPVGSSTQALSYKTARWQPSSAVQFVQRAQLWQAKQLLEASGSEPLPLLSAAAPFDAAFQPNEAATELQAGPLTRGAIGDLYRYPNTLDVVRLNGAQLKAWLEESAKAFVATPTPAEDQGDCWALLNSEVAHYNFDTILGLEYQIDSRAPVGERIGNLSHAGKPVTAEQDFYVATNNYRANGGGGFPHLDGSTTVLKGADMLSDVLLNYLKSLPQGQYEEELDNHWQVIGCGGRI